MEPKCLLFPRRCTGCGCLLLREKAVCPQCENHLPRLQYPLCHGEFTRMDRMYSIFYYIPPMDRMIQQFKFYGKRLCASYLAEQMTDSMQDILQKEKPDLITAVPMHPAKQTIRGYNQAELLARELSRRLGLPYEECLVKIRDTRAQHTLRVQERKTNLDRAFRSVPQEGKTILLVDDVCTSGATLQECAAALRQAGAKKVIGVSAALTPSEGHGRALMEEKQRQESLLENQNR